MHATTGDWLVTESSRDTGGRRRGEIIEVHGAEGGPPFLVRWTDSDGHESLVFPGPDSHVVTRAEMAARDEHATT